VTWFNSPSEDGTGVLKHVGVAIVWLHFYLSSAFSW
jgi:hypothetical protein